jgi:methyltransferase-like protein
MLKKAFSDDRNYKENIGVKPDTSLSIFQNGIDFEIPVDSLDNTVSWRLNGRRYGQDQQGNTVYYLQVQDRLILDMLRTNNWLRPVYFANTVSSTSQLGLQKYFRTEGKAYRVVPKEFGNSGQDNINVDIMTDRLKKFQFREWNNPDVYFDENIRRMLSNYRFNFMSLAEEYRSQGMPDSASYWLKWGEERIPFRPDETNESIKLLYAVRYAQAGSPDDALRLAGESESDIIQDLDYNLARFTELENEFNMLNQEFESARNQGNIRLQRELRPELQQLNNQARNFLTEVRMARQSLVLVQYVYYQAGETETALELKSKVDDMMGAGFPEMPGTRAESEQEITRYGIN